MEKIFSAFMAFMMTIIGGWFTPVTVLPEAEISETAQIQVITVMNFNVYIKGTGKKSPENRTDEVVETIRNADPDSFGVEEADEAWLKRLSAALPEYSYAGHGRDKDLGGEASAVFYKNEKYELLSTETFWLSKTPDKPSKGWDAWINRICTVAVLKDKETGFTYAHFNAHFDNSGSISRVEAIRIVSEKAVAYDMPVVFSGDLNAKEGNLMYKRALEAGFRDTKYLAETSDSGATYHGYANLHKTNSKPIDYIFVNSYCKEVAVYDVVTEKINGIYPSDHFPVVATLTMYY
ncbi:MAG: endonuclease/exonuclease/phosphatase family protein [Ruminococcaceae bacterium]|nr:endonuclease/exonuclease/phosphatase family protein [Oscillospiraceae bacterium]MBR3596405.1 endonuclease/exonuclease/phosphatase family protein [Clostridia bacterium]